MTELCCQCCGRQLRRQEMIEELADRLDWEEATEYGVNTNGYTGDTNVSLRSDGIADLLRFVRDHQDDEEVSSSE